MCLCDVNGIKFFMRITVVTQYYKPEMGAPQNRLYEMCLGLKELGADVSIVTGMPNYPTGEIFPEYKGKWHLREQLDGLEVIRYPLFASNSRRIFPRIVSMLSFSFTVLFSLRYLRRRKNDFLIIESPPLSLAYSGYLLAKWSRTKLILNISDLWPLTAKELHVIKGDSLFYRWLERIEAFLYRHSCLCMGQSEEIVNYLSEHGAPLTYLFRNGVNPSRFCEAKKPAPKVPLQIMYAGLLGYAQGVSEICKKVNFAEMNAEFHIYGAGGEQKKIEAFLAANPNRGIIYHGTAKREHIPALLAKADCTLIPLVQHIYGAVPSKIYESMAAGLPILFSGEGEGAKIILDNRLGWVVPASDFEGLIRAIRSIDTSSEEYAQIRRNCLECARTKFNRPEQIKLLHHFLSELS